MANPTICLLLFVFVFAHAGGMASESRTTRVLRLEADGEEITTNYRVFLSDFGQEFEATVNKEGFVIPAELRYSEAIGVRVVVGKEDLDFSRIDVSKFENDWVIGVDHKPFSEELTDDQDVSKVELIYYITFHSKKGLDTQLVAMRRKIEE